MRAEFKEYFPGSCKTMPISMPPCSPAPSCRLPFRPDDSPLALLDPMRLQTEAAVDFALA